MAKIYASTDSGISNREIEHADMAGWAAIQGMVLLENDRSLPLKFRGRGTKIALYGAGARFTIKGGTGSGDTIQRKVINIEQGFERAGFTVTTKRWLDDYEALVHIEHEKYLSRIREIAARQRTQALEVMFKNPFIQPAGRHINEEDVRESDTDTAIYVISRSSGEGTDRKYIKGDYELTANEEDALRYLGMIYAHVIVVLNVPGVIDTKFFHEIPGLSALVLMGMAGTSGGDSLVAVLTGRAVPSGKLTMTWANDYSDYPSSKTFGRNDGATGHADYNEGIYVGYRYFDTFGITPAYPFGYGLSYTRFDIKTENVTIDDDYVNLIINVTNVGTKYMGMEVIQAYVSKPGGRLEKPYQELVAFAKTRNLRPDETQLLTLAFKIENMASYSAKKAAWVLEKGSYYVRVGNSSRHTHVVAKITLDKTVVVRQLKNLCEPKAEINEISKKGTEVKPYSYPGEITEKRNAQQLFLSADSIKTEVVEYTPNEPGASAFKHKNVEQGLDVRHTSEGDEKNTLIDVMQGKISLDDFVSELTVEEMANLCVGNLANFSLVPERQHSMVGAASAVVPGAAGDTSSLLVDDRKIGNLIFADGPAGLRLAPHFRTTPSGDILLDTNGFSAINGADDLYGEFHKKDKENGMVDYYQFCTGIPSETLLAQSWDTNVLYNMGDIVGREMNMFGVTVWLAPGLNIMRNPLCGRNFEYFSEDPLLAGECAAYETKGLQSNPGVGACAKHFACNNQEESRFIIDSRINERALREIYLKNFEICIRSSQPMTLMSSYNHINGVHSANNRELLTNIARDEWGFEGAVVTDWGTTGDIVPGYDPRNQVRTTGLSEYSLPSKCIFAGNDWIMPGSLADLEEIIEAVEKGTSSAENASDSGDAPKQSAESVLTRADLEVSVKHILNVIMKSSRYSSAKPYTTGLKRLVRFIKVER
jgi:beta-glucosidase